MNRIVAPWTDDQVSSLNAFQAEGRMHEFTCNWGHYCLVRSLTATKDGWVCKGAALTNKLGLTTGWVTGNGKVC